MKEKNLKRILTYISLNIMKVTYVIQIQKCMIPTKNGLNILNILYKGSDENFPIHFELWEGGLIFNAYCNILYIYIALSIKKLTYFIQMYKSMLHIQDYTKDF